MSEGSQLNQRVAEVFEKAGFRTKPNSQSTEEAQIELSSGKSIPVDLYAEDPRLRVIIIGSNKSGDLKRWTEHVNSYKELGEQAKANKVLFVVTGQELEEKEKQYLKNDGMCIWGEEELSYFQAVVDAIGGWAKYEIIHSLGIRTDEEGDTHKVLALRLRQPTAVSQTELFMFTLAPERLLRTSVVFRRAQGDSKAYQRMLRRDRLPKIRDFVSKPDSLLPTDIIAHLSEQVTVDELDLPSISDKSGRPIRLSRPKGCDLVVLNIPMHYASIELIDGQHRLFGFVNADAATQQEFNLVVLGIRNLTQKQRMETFVAINDNSRRMDANLVAYLKYTQDDVECQGSPELMAIRVVVDLSKTSPFQKAIQLLDVQKGQKITLKGFCGYDLRGLLGPTGRLKKVYPTNLPSDYVHALRIYFSTIRSVFPKQWNNPDRYIIATNRGISAFLKLLKSMLKTEKQPITHEIAKKYFKALKAAKVPFALSKLQKTYVGSQGWAAFHKDLVAAIRRKYPKFKK